MQWSFFRAGAVVCLLAGSSFAQQAMPVEKLVEFIKSSVQQHMQDREVAGYLKGVRLTQRLDPRVVEDLQGQGAGPKTVAELTRLSEASASLTAAPPPPHAKKSPMAVRRPATKNSRKSWVKSASMPSTTRNRSPTLFVWKSRAGISTATTK